MADVNYFSIASNTEPVEVTGFVNPPSALAYDDTIHLSHGTQVTIKDSTIEGGREDCIDMNNGSGLVTVQDVLVAPNGSYGFTIKGGANMVLLKNVQFARHGKSYDIDLGNWSDQNKEKSKNIFLDNVTSLDGKPVRVRVLYSEKPNVTGGNVKVTVYPSWFVSIIRFFRGLF